MSMLAERIKTKMYVIMIPVCDKGQTYFILERIQNKLI